ncbi:hypothetical protein FQA47_014598 [Oryzias melastigma]|uniref:Uncharacterized protein n=1 Tax=Oryzias melastigma TaxID=30732 RepID=A0A834FLH4_ORYME|nr:hypothetical protein FQA47_014598 [Oryzias melastigma]
MDSPVRACHLSSSTEGSFVVFAIFICSKGSMDLDFNKEPSRKELKGFSSSCCHRSYAGSRLPSPKFFLSVVLLLHPLLILEDLLQQQHVPPLVKRRRHSTATDRPANQRRAGPMEQLQKERKKNVTSKKVLYFEKFHFLWLFS